MAWMHFACSLWCTCGRPFGSLVVAACNGEKSGVRKAAVTHGCLCMLVHCVWPGQRAISFSSSSSRASSSAIIMPRDISAKPRQAGPSCWRERAKRRRPYIKIWGILKVVNSPISPSSSSCAHTLLALITNHNLKLENFRVAAAAACGRRAPGLVLLARLSRAVPPPGGQWERGGGERGPAHRRATGRQSLLQLRLLSPPRHSLTLKSQSRELR